MRDNPAPSNSANWFRCKPTSAAARQLHEMLAFAARKKIKPQIEKIPLKQVNEAIERLKANAARYRIVLEI